MGRAWVSVWAEEGEVRYEEDLPSCCREEAARTREEGFECPACGARWGIPIPAEPEGCGFVEFGERRGAA